MGVVVGGWGGDEGDCACVCLQAGWRLGDPPTHPAPSASPPPTNPHPSTQSLSVDISLAALLGDDVYSFGELLLHPIVRGCDCVWRWGGVCGGERGERVQQARAPRAAPTRALETRADPPAPPPLSLPPPPPSDQHDA